MFSSPIYTMSNIPKRSHMLRSVHSLSSQPIVSQNLHLTASVVSTRPNLSKSCIADVYSLLFISGDVDLDSDRCPVLHNPLWILVVCRFSWKASGQLDQFDGRWRAFDGLQRVHNSVGHSPRCLRSVHHLSRIHRNIRSLLQQPHPSSHS